MSICSSAVAFEAAGAALPSSASLEPAACACIAALAAAEFDPADLAFGCLTADSLDPEEDILRCAGPVCGVVGLPVLLRVDLGACVATAFSCVPALKRLDSAGEYVSWRAAFFRNVPSGPLTRFLALWDAVCVERRVVAG